ncbi:response regulator [Haliangium ochraceum]|uniref:Response regulator receiver protein n=1 Tax=Haliangium ochraceum (strain DSM 14365 / JCM 11303 / SMP-2) TaxID=502025 RepID=D0LV93_HALO1|nr:response regulator [Haliangium ochraceum]ACY15934.1 response regulator receiver protein [Haliangium ochraceum DSM 14365]
MSFDLSIARRLSGVRELVGAEVLVIDQDPAVQGGMAKLLTEANLNVTCATTPREGLALLSKRFFSVAVIDLDTPTPGVGLDTITEVKATSATTAIVVLSPRRSFDEAVAVIRAGAIDIVLKSPEAVPYLKDRILEAASRSMYSREVTAALNDAKGVHEEFLRLFMDAERRALDSADRLAGRDPERLGFLDELRVLIVDSDARLADALSEKEIAGYRFDKALSGGQALDLCGSDIYHYVMVSDNLYDLPSSMVARSVKGQSPETVVLAYTGPGPGGRVDMVDNSQSRSVIPEFTSPEQLIDRLDELAAAFRAKSRERRYTQAFREQHYDFLRRYVNLRQKLERALASEPE